MRLNLSVDLVQVAVEVEADDLATFLRDDEVMNLLLCNSKLSGHGLIILDLECQRLLVSKES